MLSKADKSWLTGILTDHLGLQEHLYKIRSAENSYYRACGEDNETLDQFLCHCPVITQIKSQYLKNATIPDQNVVNDMNVEVETGCRVSKDI